MIRAIQSRTGQALLELAVCLPAVLLLILGGYAAARAAHIRLAAQSCARSELLRAGRRLPAFRERAEEAVLPEGRGVTIRVESRASFPIAGLPLPAPAGRTRAAVQVDKNWDEAGSLRELSPVTVSRAAEASVDCWDAASPAGRRITATVRTIAALGFLR